MEEQLSALLDILRHEVTLHGALEAELHREVEQDGRLAGQELLQFQVRKNKIVYRVRSLEERRIAVVAELARAWGEAPEALTLRGIIARVGPEAGGPLRACHDELQELVQRIRALALQASHNAQARLKAIDATLAVVRDALKIHPTYSGEGRLHKRTPNLKSTSV